jgi:hypothetical protein
MDVRTMILLSKMQVVINVTKSVHTLTGGGFMTNFFVVLGVFLAHGFKRGQDRDWLDRKGRRPGGRAERKRGYGFSPRKPQEISLREGSTPDIKNA